MIWLLTTIGVYLHLFTYKERCGVCFQNVYWKPKCGCRECKNVICSGCAGNLVADPELNYKCPYCRADNQISNIQVLNKEFFLNVWRKNNITFLKDGER